VADCVQEMTECCKQLATEIPRGMRELFNLMPDVLVQCRAIKHSFDGFCFGRKGTFKTFLLPLPLSSPLAPFPSSLNLSTNLVPQPPIARYPPLCHVPPLAPIIQSSIRIYPGCFPVVYSNSSTKSWAKSSSKIIICW
jgi:hypothetical protein